MTSTGRSQSLIPASCSFSEDNARKTVEFAQDLGGKEKVTQEVIAEYTVDDLYWSVTVVDPGIMFFFGGQCEKDNRVCSRLGRQREDFSKSLDGRDTMEFLLIKSHSNQLQFWSMKLKTMRILQHASVVFLIIILCASASSSATSKELRAYSEEALALLKWKSSLDKQSQSLLSSWEIKNPSPSNHCSSWFGISCNNAGRVDNITIKSHGLRGMLSDLNFSSLRYLTTIDLYNNSLSGKIPSELFQLVNLKILDLESNKIVGTIPRDIGQLRCLTKLDFDGNNLSGFIPSSIGNLSRLTSLYLGRNQLVGTIPQEIGFLRSLTDLRLLDNNLSGLIPSTIGNLSYLNFLLLTNNQLVGTIPPEIGLLKSLTYLSFFGNSLSGSIPSSLNNITKLEEFVISENHITGQLPDNICRGGYLKLLAASNNNIIGHVPKTLKTCTSLQRVRLETNHITGNLSEDFGVYPHLNYIDLSHNNFYGELSRNWGSCENLTSLKISDNNISGRIPTEIGLAQNLQRLDLSSNHLSGQVPRNLGKLLADINLSNNELLGSVPVEFGELSKLEALSLGANNLSGLIPRQLAKCLKLRILNLTKNRLAGNIPIEIGNFRVLEILDLAQNLLSGEIPQQVGQLVTLETLNLSHNQFSGSIPQMFTEMVSLVSINLSYNRLEGPIPIMKAFQQASFEAFRENKDLCGNIIGLKACPVHAKDGAKKKRNTGNTTLIVVSILSFSMLISVILGFLIFKKNQRKTISDTPRENNEDLFSIWSYDGKLVYKNIIEDTENFDEKYCIGVGGSGAVYKFEQPSGQVFAVKKLHSVEHGELNNEKAFKSEICVLAEIRHRNIVKLYGFCSHSRHSFLVYEFLEGGDLQNILSDENKAIDFGWTKRIDVIKGVANGLSYMHHECSPPIVHRDISSKNILLDTEHVAHISDFGTARILKTNSTNCTSFAGTFGYAAPELAHTMEVNEMQDVYSFGVLTLEVLMGRHPGDFVSHFSSSGKTPHDSESTLLKDVLDPRLPIPRTICESEGIVYSLKLAFACLQVVPRHRPTMKQVSIVLCK